jgi:ribosomal protein L39E
MKKLFAFIILSTFSFTLYSQDQAPKKIRKYKIEHFKALSINDTSDAVIDLFYSKKESAIFNQMSLLPLSIVLTVAPTPAQVIGIGSFVISGPLFISGSYKLVRYRKKKLHKVLSEYKTNRTLPKWVRNKTDKLLNEYQLQQMDY